MEEDYLFANGRGQKLLERFGELPGGYNNQFVLYRRILVHNLLPIG
jgi:hypothetical protein